MRYYELHAEVCKTFGHPKRLLIISLLRDGELSVGSLIEKSGIDAILVGEHLMRQADIGLAVRKLLGAST